MRNKGANILIKNDGPCPADGIIGSGITDSQGKFTIYVIAKIWDESDGLIWVHADFNGNEKFLPSISDGQTLVVRPLHGEERCEE